ncbi:MFS transporter [Gordonia sp. CPCC 205333]|uniref:MFS transporter n=1 Tax=Gordonia sp. CPCC 205333 TaxID=3140790 RepID=UPI003AF3D921
MRSRSPSSPSAIGIFLSSLTHSPGLGRLLAVRLTSQITDGVFQAALFTAILFNPERHTDPLAVAGGFAVLLLPYSVLGPFAGALLDHWDRRSVLVYANIIRAALIAVVAVTVATGAPQTVVLIGALVVTGASRFVNSGLSASLPHVVSKDVLVAMNSLFTTLGAGMLAVGAGITVGLRAVFGDDNTGSAETTMAGVVCALIAAWIAHRFPRKALGPDIPDDAGHSALHAVSVGLTHGGRAVAAHRTVGAALSAIGAHRLVFGMNTLMLLVLIKHQGLGSGFGDIAVIAACTAAGAFVAAVTTPLSVARVGRRNTILLAMAVGVIAQLALLGLAPIAVGIAAAILGLVGQTAKLCGDVAMQLDITDTVRGQVFSVQDAVFNIAYVAAITIAALTIPDDGRSSLLIFFGAVLYVCGGLATVALYRGIRHAPDQAAPAALG